MPLKAETAPCVVMHVAGVDNSSAALPQPPLSRPATGQVATARQRGGGSPRRLFEVSIVYMAWGITLLDLPGCLT
jgi:hypothetical protein